MAENCTRSGRWNRHAGRVGLVVVLALASSVVAQPTPDASAPAAQPPQAAAPTVVVRGPAKAVRRIQTAIQCDHLTTKDGLPFSYVTSIVQDKLGFMWFGTTEGLARYDGIRMVKERPRDNDETSISSTSINALAVDADGKVWVGTDRGINLWDPATNKFTRFLHSESASGTPSGDGVNAILRDRKDRMWFATSGGGLNRFDPATNKFVDYNTEPLKDKAIRAISVDGSGNLWLGTSEDGVIRWNPDTKETATFDPDKLEIGSKLNDVFVASTGKVWIATEVDGVAILDPQTGKTAHLIHEENDPTTITNDRIARIFEDANKAMWIGTWRGLSRVDANGTITSFDYVPNDPSSLPAPEVLTIYQDRSGLLWFGTFTAGICKVNEAKLQFGFHRTRAGQYVNAVAEGKKGTIWVGAYNDGIYRYDMATQTETVYYRFDRRADGKPGVIDLAKDAWLTPVYQAKDGTLWVGIKGRGLVAFDPATETYKDYLYNSEAAVGIPYHTVLDIWEDPSGTLWLGMWGDDSPGLVKFDPRAEKFTPIAESDGVGLTSNSYIQIYPDPKEPNIVWLATDGGGVVRFDVVALKGTSFRFKADDPASLGSDSINAIVRDADGTLWLGTTNGGFNHLDPQTGKVERYTTSNSKLTSNTIQSVLQDNSGQLWLGTNQGGLVRFDPKKKEFFQYTKNDGAQDDFNVTAFNKTSTGELLFGGHEGWNSFNPTAIVQDSYVPPVVITGFRIGNQDVKLEKPTWTQPTLTVSYTDSFEIQFAALAYAAPKENRYSYKLEPYDDKFTDTDRPYASYAKVPGGKYTLRIRAANRHGVWNETGMAIKIAVTPSIFRTWPAFAVYILLVLGAILALIRFQRERLHKAERDGRLALVERDLALTGAVQTSFLPDQNEISTQKLQVIGLYRPADACGGDWWWHQMLNDGRHLIMVGDVTGHGPGPAMVTAAVATAFRVLLETGVEDVSAVLAALNREVLRVGKGRYHMTMATLEIFEMEGRWVLHSAGGPPILALNSKGKHRVVFCPGTPLGTENGFEIGHVEGRFRPSDRMLLYTDGIPEIMLPGGNALGMRKFAHMYEGTRNQHLREAAHHIMQEADRTQGNQPQADDWTFTLLEWVDNDASVVTSTQSLTSLH